jgi:hypothetical protein
VTSVERTYFGAALVLATVVRAAMLVLPGTHDVDVWRIWTYSAAVDGATRVYGVGGTPPERRLLQFNRATTTVDYPPLALYELAVVGRAYRLVNGGTFPDTAALSVAIKTAIVLFDLGCAALVYLMARRAGGETVARWAVLAYWINPAVVLDGAALGYLDPLFVLPALAALAAVAAGWPALAGAAVAAAVLTKAQGVVLAPAVALAIWLSGDPSLAVRRAGSAIAGACAAAIAIVAPVAAIGAWPNLQLALSRLATHDMLSANACNLWWIVGYLVRAAHAVADRGAWTAFTMPTSILGITRLTELGYPINARLAGAVLTGAAAAWALWTARRMPDLWLTAALGAFLVHAYAALAAQVHENHLFAAVPLLALAAAGRPRYRSIFFAVSAIFALNLNIFYGVSEGARGPIAAVPRDITIIDLSAVLALANCATLLWHGLTLRRECSTAAGRLLPPVPA